MTISYDFSGKTVLITGAASGIGRATALAFGAAGAKVAVGDISAEGGATVEAIRAAGGEAQFYTVDVSDEAAVRDMVDRVVAHYGTLDIAHNNAGIEGHVVPMLQVPSDNWRRVIDVNLSSAFYCMKAEIGAMLKQGGGVIVNTASASGLIGGYRLSAYTAAKHGLIGLTKAAAMDYAEDNIRINALCPGLIDTPFIHALPQAARDQLLTATPMARPGTPEEMAQVVLWLSSDGASYVTGHSMSADGGVVLGGTGTKIGHILDAMEG